MEATADELGRLIELQNIDLDIRRCQKELDDLPQRGVIIETRKRKEVIEEKQAKVLALRKDTERKINRINDEDASLLKKQQGVQAALEAAKGDFRNAEARSKELDGILKRRATLDEELTKLSDEISKIETLEAQINHALDDIAAKEQNTIMSFQKEGGALKQTIADLQIKRTTLGADLPVDILRLYEKTSARTGGVAIGALAGNRCGACRSTIDSGRLIELRNQAPLGVCPSCKRLLIIREV